MLVAILRDVAHAVQRAPANRRAGDILPIQVDFAADERFQARQTVHELRLTVAINARKADDFARAHLQRHIFDRVVLVHMGRDGHVFYLQHDLAGLRRFLLDVEVDVAPDHHRGQFLRRGVLRVHRADVLALAQHRAAVGNRHNLRQLMGDEEDRLALCCQIAHNLHQFVNLLRRQDGGRLVENQDFVVAVEHFEDFRALLHPNGDILHLRVGVDVQPVTLGQRQHLLPRLFLLQETEFRRFNAQNDVVQHGEALHQLEVLVYHADAQRGGVIGVADGHRFAILPDFAFLRLIQAEKDAHQRRFARAVLTQQRVDFAVAQLEGDVVIGNDAGKALGDMQHFDGIRRAFVRRLNALFLHEAFPP